MFARTIPFNEMQGQRRWKVEFFCADRDSARSTTYPLVQLKEVLTERRESLDPQQYAEHTFNYLGLEHVESLTGDLVDSYAPRTGKTVLSRCKIFRQGDVLYGRLRPVLNKVFVADEFLPEGICSGEFYVLIPELDRLLPCFARAILASRYVQDIVKSMTTGSALPRLQLDDLLEVEVPLPPLKTQKIFEQKIREQNIRRRSLRSEVTRGPVAMLDSLVESLESGANFDFDLTVTGLVSDFSDNRLPKVHAPKGRSGRPRKNDHKQLELKLAE